MGSPVPCAIRKSNRGFTLLETLVSVFVLSMVFIVWSRGVESVSSNLKTLQSRASAASVGSSIRSQVIDWRAFENSATIAGNSDFAKCLNGTVENGCTAFAEKDMSLMGPISVPQLDSLGQEILDDDGQPIIAPDLVTGTNDLTCDNAIGGGPAFYTIEGIRCKCGEPAALCPLQAVSQFSAICPRNEATCTMASAFKVSYKVKVRSDLESNPSFKNIMDRVETGTVMINNNRAPNLFVKFVFAQSSYILGGSQSSNGSLSEFDIQQGTALSFIQPSTLSINVSFQSPEPIARVDLWGYAYPLGCTLDTIGGTGSNAGASVNCNAPAAGDFVNLTASSPSFAAPSMGLTASLTASAPDQRIYELKAVITNPSGVKVAETDIPLRATFVTVPALKVTLPAGNQTMYACDPASTVNTFTFQATSFTGWKTGTVLATLTPTSGATATIPFPQFNKFNPNNPAPQNIILDPTVLQEGASYILSFQGMTNDGTLVTAPTATFLVKPHPSKTVGIGTPTGTKVRTISDVTIGTNLNIGCQDTPTAIKTKVTKLDGTVLMPEKDVTGFCTKVASAPDENRYYCPATFPCTDWLGVATNALCATSMPNDTNLQATSSFTDSDGQFHTSSGTFLAGSKVTAQIARDYVQWVHFKSAGPTALSLVGQMAPVNITFASSLLSGEVARFKLVGTSGTYTFNCANSSACNTTIPTPSSGDVFTLESLNPELVTIGDSKTVTFKYVDDTTLACAPAAVTCPAGQTMARKLDVIGSYGFTWGVSATGWRLNNYHLENPASPSAIDFFISYKPRQTSAPTNFGVAFSIPLDAANATSTISFDGNMFVATPTSCTAIPDRCPSDFVQVPATFMADFISTIGTKGIGIGGSGQSFATGADGQPGVVIVRQCYCQ